MQNVKNFIQGKALGVAEYLTPILKVISTLSVWVFYLQRYSFCTLMTEF